MSYTPRHMAPREYVVLCGNEEAHHHLGGWPTPEEAQRWADTTLCCVGRHKVCRLGVLAEVGA